MSDTVLLEVADRVATITLNRPEQRNALSVELLGRLPEVLQEADGSDDVDVLVLTGADPAFCAGLDLKEIGAGGGPVGRATRAEDARGPFPPLGKPLIGAVNGACITGGLELALNCDFLVASERAVFGDTHARVGIHPGWGLTVLLAEAIGVRRAREMSFSGNFLTAAEALQWGLVNHVVPHDELLATARRLGTDIASVDQATMRQIRATYAEVVATTGAEGWEIEARNSRAWLQRTFDPAEVERRRQAIVDRGRTQQA